MKVYKKEIDGTYVIRPANKIVVIKDGMQTINPTHEMIISDGWEEQVPENVDNPIEITLERAKTNKVQIILNHDSSESINVFYIKEKPIWLDKATRVGLKLRFESELESGLVDTTLWYNGAFFQLKLDVAMKILLSVERYASMCYDNTQRHIANVMAMDNIDDVSSYDYYDGYPKVLKF